MASPISAVTASGIRTTDGTDHDVDTIVYGTGLTIADREASLVGAGGGLTLQQIWRDGMEPYLGVALHGFPNYFTVSGPEFDAAMHYVVECLQLMKGHARIEVRRSSQQVFNERVHLRGPSRRLVASAFDLVSSVGVRDDIYDAHGRDRDGGRHLPRGACPDSWTYRPIDGQYHWQGTLFGQLPADVLARVRTVTLVVGERSVSARIIEETPQGTHSIAGVGAPPFALADVEFATVPQP